MADYREFLGWHCSAQALTSIVLALPHGPVCAVTESLTGCPFMHTMIYKYKCRRNEFAAQEPFPSCSEAAVGHWWPGKGWAVPGMLELHSSQKHPKPAGGTREP